MLFDNDLKNYSLGRAVVGCNDNEIAAIEGELGVDLPSDYKQFLKVMGRSAPGFFVGSDFEIDKLVDIQEWADDLRKECGLAPLDESVFVFLIHQGYQFYYFHDGEVHYFMEGWRESARRFSSFAEFFRKYAKHN